MEALIARLEKKASESPQKTAVAFKSETLDYGSLIKKIRNVAGVLAEKGVEKGDRIGLSAISKPETPVIYLGIQYLGAIAVFIDKNSIWDNIYEICKDAGVKYFITDKVPEGKKDDIDIISMAGLYESIPETVPEYILPDENDIAELLYTTGTTGKPKGVMLSHGAVYNILKNTIDGVGYRETDVILLPLPLNHSFALRVLRANLFLGATIVLQNGFTFARALEKNIEQYKCNCMAAVASSLEIVNMQMQDRFGAIIGGMRLIEISASALSVAQRKKYVRLLPNTEIHNTWGSSETGGAVFLNVSETVNKNPEKISALGRPISGIEVLITDDEGNALSGDPSQTGRLAIKGNMVMSGYWKRDDLTKKTLLNDMVLTGDMACMDGDGYVYMLGRADDIINMGGEKLSPVEVENIASEFDGVIECACVGVDDPDGIMEAVPVLFVVSNKASFDVSELAKHMTAHLERYKHPREYMLLSELPRNRMGKVDRFELKRVWKDRGDEELMNPVIQTIISRRSVRRFIDKPIPEKLLNMILKAGYHAPSGHNMQSWRFTVITDESKIAELKEATREAAEKNKIYFYGWENPKVLILISNDERNEYGRQDASAATENIFLAAWSYGIGSVWLNPLMKLRHEEPVCHILDSFDIPQTHVVWCTAALGYPAGDVQMLAKKTDVIKYV